MQCRGVIRRCALLVAIAVGALLAGCAAASTPTDSPMMDGPALSASAGNPSVNGSPMAGGAAGMMQAEPGYTYSKLSCSVPAALPGAVVTVMLGDMGMTQMMGGTAPLGALMMLRAAPAELPAGQISVAVRNVGWRTHELVILPLAAGAAAGDRVPGPDGKVDEAGSLGEASNNCAEGAGDGITAGAVGWTTVTLTPGRYELVCNLQNHYANGMYQEFVVT
jgi:uncharacterized cupredoxin-like copper-binding protein